MGGATSTYECRRCGAEFDSQAHHTEIVRRDFVDVPRPTRVERLCADCFEVYVTEFLEEDFEAAMNAYETIQ